MPGSFVQLEDKIWKAGRNYVPRVYPGKVTLFRASNQPLGIYPDPTLGWEALVAGDLEIHEVPGHHGSLVKEPYVPVLAKELEHCIESARWESAQSVETAPRVDSNEREQAYATVQ